MARTDSEKLGMLPVKVKLGDQEYELPILRTLKMRAWREQLMTSLGPTLASFGIQVAEAGEAGVENGIVAALLRFPEKVIDLIFLYSPELPKEKVLEEATEEQFVAAFLTVLEPAYPFLGALAMVRAIMSSELPSSSVTPGPSRLQ